MIEGIFGRPGAGKTYAMTARALEKREKGFKVFSNYPIDGCDTFGEDDLLHLPPGYIVLDEAHLWLSSRAFHKLPHSWLVKLSQTRKSGWHLIYSAQHPMRVDKALRDVSHVFWWCHAWPGGFDRDVKPRVFIMRAYEPHHATQCDPNDQKLKLAQKVFPFRKNIAAAYDTMGTIDGAAHLMDLPPLTTTETRS